MIFWYVCSDNCWHVLEVSWVYTVLVSSVNQSTDIKQTSVSCHITHPYLAVNSTWFYVIWLFHTLSSISSIPLPPSIVVFFSTGLGQVQIWIRARCKQAALSPSLKKEERCGPARGRPWDISYPALCRSLEDVTLTKSLRIWSDNPPPKHFGLKAALLKTQYRGIQMAEEMGFYCWTQSFEMIILGFNMQRAVLPSAYIQVVMGRSGNLALVKKSTSVYGFSRKCVEVGHRITIKCGNIYEN